jgi:hypothetical protein
MIWREALSPERDALAAELRGSGEGSLMLLTTITERSIECS